MDDTLIIVLGATLDVIPTDMKDYLVNTFGMSTTASETKYLNYLIKND